MSQTALAPMPPKHPLHTWSLVRVTLVVLRAVYLVGSICSAMLALKTALALLWLP
jgi:hypothetical protein